MERMNRMCLLGAFMLALSVPAAYPQKAPSGAAAEKHAEGVTADEQGTNPEDQEITQKIRQSVVEDDSLSMAAHNTKIITMNGKVTLRGKVESKAEKQAIEAKAKEVAGASHVKNELTVAPSDSAAKPQTK